MVDCGSALDRGLLETEVVGEFDEGMRSVLMTFSESPMSYFAQKVHFVCVFASSVAPQLHFMSTSY